MNEVLKIQARDVISAQNLLNIYSGKGAKQRVVPMSALLAVRIHRFMSWRKVPKGNFIFGCKRNRNAAAKLKNPVLKHPYGKMSGSNVVRDLGLLCEHLAIRRFQFHGLRHTFATKYLKNGGDVARLRKLMGHSSIQTTMIYEHLDHADIIENFTDYTPF